MNDQDYHNMVEEMLDTEDAGFSIWEIDFLDAMHDRRNYTDNMKEKIEQIYDDKMKGE